MSQRCVFRVPRAPVLFAMVMTTAAGSAPAAEPEVEAAEARDPTDKDDWDEASGEAGTAADDLHLRLGWAAHWGRRALMRRVKDAGTRVAQHVPSSADGRVGRLHLQLHTRWLEAFDRADELNAELSPTEPAGAYEHRGAPAVAQGAWSAVRESSHEIRLGLGGGAGVALGTLTTAAFPYGFASVRGRVWYTVWWRELFRFQASGGGALGAGEGGAAFGSYAAGVSAGVRWWRMRGIHMVTELQMGVGSVRFIPGLTLGVGHDVTVLPAEFTPLQRSWYEWSITWTTEAGTWWLYAPSVATGVSSTTTINLWKLFAGVEGGVRGGAQVAILSNELSGAGYLRLLVGLRN